MHMIGINTRNEKPQEIQVRQQNGRLADQQLSEGLKLWQDRVNPRACGAVNSWDFRVMWFFMGFLWDFCSDFDDIWDF